MAREIVITSVPRGVKLGRTGFQVAMQTAGMRDDLASQLEKMAGYRHLPTGAPNPVCYFHRITKTFAGQVSVLGRIVDAGVDFSNRSNKLAHMVVLEAADVGQVASSSPAAALAAIEGRLASVWPGPPEERREPFSLVGIPMSQAARCGLWQQVMGDAGWAGVLAERAERGQPTLVIGQNSSPASCRQMLALFQEALAIVPAAKRWSVTFDTTSLSPEGVLWRGTYAGSPESQTAQPGVLVVDLSRPQAIPSNLAAGDLVKIAREGPQSPVVTRPGLGPGAIAPPVTGAGQSVQGGSGSAVGSKQPAVPVGVGGAPPPPPIDPVDVFEKGTHGHSKPKSSMGLIVSLVLGLAVLALGGGGIVLSIVLGQAKQREALEKFCTYADNDAIKDEPAPAKDDLARALGYWSGTDKAEAAAESLSFLNAWLKSEEGTGQSVKDKAALQKILAAVEAVRSETSDKHRESLAVLVPGRGNGLYQRVAKAHEQRYSDWPELRGQVALATIVGYANKTQDWPVPSAVDYRYALGPEPRTGGQQGFDKATQFLNGFLSRTDVTGDDVATPDKLKSLWEAVESLQAERPKDGGRQGLDLLARSDKESVKLLDEIHPKPFADYHAFQNLVSDVAALRKLVKTQTADRKNPDVSPALWDVIVAHAAITEADKKDETARKKFAKSVVEDDLSGVALVKKVSGAGPPKPPAPGFIPPPPVPPLIQDGFAKFQGSIKKFRLEKRDVLASLPSGVELFTCENGTDVMARVGVLPTIFEPVLNNGKVMVGSDEILTIETTGSSVRAMSGEHWAKHRAHAQFMPIAFAKRPRDLPEKDDWIVLSPPDSRQMPGGGKTLYDLFCDEKGSVSVKVPEKVNVDKLQVVVDSVRISDDKLTVRLRQPKGLPLLLEITGTIAGQSYTLAEAIKFDSQGKKFGLFNETSWNGRQSRFGKLANKQPEQERIVIGFKDGAPTGKWQNPESNFADMVSALLGREKRFVGDEWDVLRDAWCGFEKQATRGQGPISALPGKREYPDSLERWRKKLQDYLVGRSEEGFAKDAISRYRDSHPPKDDEGEVLKEDPGGFVEEAPGKDKPAPYKAWEQRRDRHVRMKEAWDRWSELAKQEVMTAVRDADSLRGFVERCGGGRGTQKESGKGKQRDGVEEIDPGLAAVQVLLELDSLIVAKVFREELEALLKQVPVEAFVQGTVKPREWSIEGLVGKPEGAVCGTVLVEEMKLMPFEVRLADDHQQPVDAK
jgi:hypothetical protein